jgi:hypothetical protein
MTSYGGKELASAFRTVRKNTIQVAEDIPESKYSFVAAPEVRSVGRMLTHIAIATRVSEDIDKTKHLTTLARPVQHRGSQDQIEGGDPRAAAN